MNNIKRFLLVACLIGLVVSATSAFGQACFENLNQGEKRIVTQGTFLLTLKKGVASVSSYVPSGTVLQIQGAREIRHHKREGFAPIPKCYFAVLTDLGKSGYVLQDESVPVAKFPGKNLFPRTQIEIYKYPDKEKIARYRRGELDKAEIFLSSTYPKNREKLRVVGVDDELDFFIVEAEFLGPGIRGYVSASRGRTTLSKVSG